MLTEERHLMETRLKGKQYIKKKDLVHLRFPIDFFSFLFEIISKMTSAWKKVIQKKILQYMWMETLRRLSNLKKEKVQRLSHDILTSQCMHHQCVQMSQLTLSLSIKATVGRRWL